jgi:hypothetical protein
MTTVTDVDQRSSSLGQHPGHGDGNLESRRDLMGVVDGVDGGVPIGADAASDVAGTAFASATQVLASLSR